MSISPRPHAANASRYSPTHRLTSLLSTATDHTAATPYPPASAACPLGPALFSAPSSQVTKYCWSPRSQTRTVVQEDSGPAATQHADPPVSLPQANIFEGSTSCPDPVKGRTAAY